MESRTTAARSAFSSAPSLLELNNHQPGLLAITSLFSGRAQTLELNSPLNFYGIAQGSGRINGYLQIISTSTKKIQGIRVRFVRRQVLAFPQDHGLEEEDEVVEAELMLGAEGMELPKGIST